MVTGRKLDAHPNRHGVENRGRLNQGRAEREQKRVRYSLLLFLPFPVVAIEIGVSTRVSGIYNSIDAPVYHDVCNGRDPDKYRHRLVDSKTFMRGDLEEKTRMMNVFCTTARANTLKLTR